MTDDNNDNPANRAKIVPLADKVARDNRKVQGRTEIMTGEVTTVMDLSDISAIAFGVRNGGSEKLFWVSAKTQAEDRDFRRPLAGEQVKVWFSAAAQSLPTPEGPALGVVELRNISNDSEEKAFAWFRAKRDGGPLPPAN